MDAKTVKVDGLAGDLAGSIRTMAGSEHLGRLVSLAITMLLWIGVTASTAAPVAKSGAAPTAARPAVVAGSQRRAAAGYLAIAKAGDQSLTTTSTVWRGLIAIVSLAPAPICARSPPPSGCSIGGCRESRFRSGCDPPRTGCTRSISGVLPSPPRRPGHRHCVSSAITSGGSTPPTDRLSARSARSADSSACRPRRPAEPTVTQSARWVASRRRRAGCAAR